MFASYLKRIDVASANPRFVSINGVLYDRDMTTLLCVPANYENQLFEFPKGVKHIGANAFFNCRNMREVVLPDDLESMGDEAFYYCGIFRVIFPATLTHLPINCFAYTALTDVVVPSTVTSMDGGVFSNCQSLVSAQLPDELPYVAPGTFFNCVNLEKVNIPHDAEVVGYNSFNNCYKLTKVVIPNKVREIEYRAYGCNFNPYNHGTLDTLILGKSLTTIGSNAFVGQNMINYIKSYNTVPPVVDEEGAWTSTAHNKAMVCVPQQSLQTYKSASIWSLFKNWSDFILDVNGVSEDNLQYRTSEGAIEFQGEGLIEVYSISGTCIYRGQATRVEVPAKGVYIIRAGGQTAKVNDAIIEADWSGRTKDVNISFKAPTKTGSDKPLNSITKIEIMRQGIVQKTFNNPTPGAELTYVDKPDAAGEYIYRIVPYNSAGQGGVVEATVNVGAPGKSVPYVEDFSSADRWENELVFIDANNDGTCFWHATATTPPYAWVHNNGKDGTTFDDYLITPGIELKEGDTYKISADAYGYGHNMSILIGSAPKIADLTNNVKTETLGEDWVNYSGEFVAPYTGKFYIGIRDFAEAGKALSDFHVANIRLDRIGGPGTPAAITNLVITPDATGAPKMTFKFNAPNKTYDNKTLESLTKVTIKRDGAEVKSFENPAPGAALEYTDAPGADGEYSYTFMAFNDKGDGSPTEYLGFAGVDLPALPTNIVATDMGNGKVKITWDPVTKTLHGAEIPAPPIYVVLESGDTDETQLGQTTKCEYIYDAYDVNEQKHFWYAIFPFNSKNEHGSYGKSNDIFVGKAYTLSFLESFENGSPKSPLAIQHLVFSPAWSLCTDATFSDLNSCDGDNGFLAQKGYINNKSVASTGKISLKDAISPTFSFYIDNINPEDYQNEIAVVVREVGNPEWHEIYHKKIREVVPNKGWGRISVDLKAWKGKDIHVGLIPTVNYTDDTHASYYSWTLMDALRVHNLTNKDLGGNMIISSESVDAGQDVDINVTVTNNGEQPSGAYRVDLYKNNKVVDSLNGASLASGKSQVITFSQGTNVADKDQVEFFAKVVLAGDENEKDNTTSVGTIKVNKPIYPAVNGLAAEEMAEAKGSIAVTWTAPSMDQVPPTPFTETFETAPSYSLTDACGWTLVDVDKTPVAGFQQFNFPGITIGTTLASFFVVDNTASELGQFASILGGNNGSKKSLGSLLAYSGTPDDWAISPELYGGAQVVSFYGKNLQDNMPEKVELWYSTGSLDPNDFIFVKKWDLTNSAYTKYSAYIPEGAKRVAIRHNFEGGILQVDDINFRRAGDTKETVTLKGYNVYRDGELLNENPITAMRYVDTNVEEGDHEYAVNAIYDKGESNSRTVTVHSSSVGDVLEGKTAVYGSYGTIEILNACGQAVTLVSVDGTVLYNGIGQDNMTIRAAAGIYLVKVADKAYKVTVK